MMTRRELLRFAILLPAGAWLSRFQTLAEPELGKDSHYRYPGHEIKSFQLSRSH